MKSEDIVTEKDLPTINAILRSGERVTIVPVRGGKRIFRVQQKETKPQGLGCISSPDVVKSN